MKSKTRTEFASKFRIQQSNCDEIVYNNCKKKLPNYSSFEANEWKWLITEQIKISFEIEIKK